MDPEAVDPRNFIKYTFGIDDMTIFTEYQLLRSQTGLKRQKRIRAQMTIITILFYFIGGLFLWRIYSSIVGLWFPPLLAVFGLSISVFLISNKTDAPYFMRKRIRKHYSEGENKGLFCEHTLTLVENGFVEKTTNNETRISWEGLEKIESEPSYTYLYTSADSAFVIPHKNVIEGDLSLFLDGIKRHYEPSPPMKI